MREENDEMMRGAESPLPSFIAVLPKQNISLMLHTLYWLKQPQYCQRNGSCCNANAICYLLLAIAYWLSAIAMACLPLLRQNSKIFCQSAPPTYTAQDANLSIQKLALKPPLFQGLCCFYTNFLIIIYVYFYFLSFFIYVHNKYVQKNKECP